jgi:hypothetical protein
MELSIQKALEEVHIFREQSRSLGEERKRDIEETADFIKQVTENTKRENQRDLS